MRDLLKQLDAQAPDLYVFLYKEAKEYVRLVRKHDLYCPNLVAYETHLQSMQNFYANISVEGGGISIEIPFYLWDEDYTLYLSTEFFSNREEWLKGQIDYTSRMRKSLEATQEKEAARKREYEMKQLRELQEKYPHISHNPSE